MKHTYQTPIARPVAFYFEGVICNPSNPSNPTIPIHDEPGVDADGGLAPARTSTTWEGE